jgi:hypothetical protein
LLTGPAAKFLYSVAGRTVLINTYDEWSSMAPTQLFSGWFLHRLTNRETATPDITLNIRCGITPPPIPADLSCFEIMHGGICYTDEEIYYITFGDSVVMFGPGRSTEVNLWFDQSYQVPSDIVTQMFSHALSPALRRTDVFEIHSAAVVPPGRTGAVLLAGPSGSGKSTLTSQLARCGWGYLSDDILLLTEREQQIKVQAFRRFFALTADTMTAAKLQSANKLSSGRKERLTPQDHFQQPPTETARATTIVFPAIVAEQRSRFRQLTSAESMQRLLRLCPWSTYDKPTSGTHLKTLGLLASTTSAYELLAGQDVLADSNSAVEVIQTMVGEMASSS